MTTELRSWEPKSVYRGDKSANEIREEFLLVAITSAFALVRYIVAARGELDARKQERDRVFSVCFLSPEMYSTDDFPLYRNDLC